MARLSELEWIKARAFFEAGASQSATAEKFSVSRKAVQLKIEAQGWSQDLEGQIKRKVAEKLAGNSHPASAKETAAAIGAEADRRVKVAERHVKLAEQALQLQQQALGKPKPDEQGEGPPKFQPDFDLQKSAKINMETIGLLIALERKIHKLEDVPDEGRRDYTFSIKRSGTEL